MHYYKRNIGDYYKKAGRLSMLQHGAYTLLIDACYDRERFPTADEAIEWAWASTEAEIEAVKFVLSKFFHDVEGVFVQQHIKDDLIDYADKAEKNRTIALEREAKRRQNRTNEHEPCTNGSRVEHESPPNHKPLTNNQEPVTKKPKEKTVSPSLDYSCWPSMPNDELFAEWKELRKRKRAAISQTVINRVGKELHKAASSGFTVDQCFEQWIYKGWSGCEAEWMSNSGVKKPSQMQPITGITYQEMDL